MTVVIVGLAQIAFAILFDVFRWDENFTVTKVAGIGIIVVSVAGMALARPAHR